MADPENRTLSGPEHQLVRLPVVEALVKAGWDRNQLQWAPEWRVPKSPHDAASREGGKSFSAWPVDLALFEDASTVGSWEHVVVLFEFKAPDLNAGISQLEVYLTREPRARMGFWTNGSEDVRVYKLADGGFLHQRGRGIPRPGDDLTKASKEPLTFADLKVPKSGQLRSVFRRLLDVVVARDSKATRSETQLDQLCNLLLLKLESDTNGEYDPTNDLVFQLSEAGESYTARKMRVEFQTLRNLRPEVFAENEKTDLLLDDHTIAEVVYELSSYNLLAVGAEAISSAFQVFRRANLKAGEGQYFTPERVISAAIEILDIRPQDKIIDPACGTGGFLVQAFLSVLSHGTGKRAEAQARTWAHRQVFGVDKDAINVKLTRAIMVSLGDGSVNIHSGDSIREHRWKIDYPYLEGPLTDGSFTVVVTNPPFGKNLKVSASDSRANQYSIAKQSKGTYVDLEIGLIFLERAHRLLMKGGRLGIILPETYFFSSTYSWLPDWLEPRFKLRGVFNIPMEAFQGFCRAKTNFYVFEKR
ncbi:HsdM family class I SAM-dependent methyltransferase [Gordonia sp. NPDC003424]